MLDSCQGDCLFWEWIFSKVNSKLKDEIWSYEISHLPGPSHSLLLYHFLRNLLLLTDLVQFIYQPILRKKKKNSWMTELFSLVNLPPNFQVKKLWNDFHMVCSKSPEQDNQSGQEFNIAKLTDERFLIFHFHFKLMQSISPV